MTDCKVNHEWMLVGITKAHEDWQSVAGHTRTTTWKQATLSCKCGAVKHEKIPNTTEVSG